MQKVYDPKKTLLDTSLVTASYSAPFNIINFNILSKTEKKREVTKKLFLIKITHTVNQFDILRDSKRI